MAKHVYHHCYRYPIEAPGLFRVFVGAMKLLGAIVLILGMGVLLTHCNTESEADRMKAREKAFNDEQAAQTTEGKKSIWDAERQDGRLKVQSPEPAPPVLPEPTGKPPKHVANAWK